VLVLGKVGVEKPKRMGFMNFMTVVIAKPSEQQVKKEVQAMRAAATRISSTQEKARSFLIEKGYITKGNKLTRKYG